MKHWIVIAVTLVCAAVLCWIAWNVWNWREEKERRAALEAVLRAYQQALKPGMTRAQVEEYLQSKGAPFQRTCCINGSTLAADTTKIWQGKALWYCSDNSVYVAFQFTSLASDPNVSDPKDVLDKVMLDQHFGGCL